MDQTAYFNQMREKRKKEILSAARKMLLKMDQLHLPCRILPKIWIFPP